MQHVDRRGAVLLLVLLLLFRHAAEETSLNCPGLFRAPPRVAFALMDMQCCVTVQEMLKLDQNGN